MYVSKDKQIYKCFSCGAAGNVVNFVMDYEHVSFMEALKILGSKCGIEVSGVTHNVTNKNTTIYDIYDLAFKFFCNNLNTSYGLSAKEY